MRLKRVSKFLGPAAGLVVIVWGDRVAGRRVRQAHCAG